MFKNKLIVGYMCAVVCRWSCLCFLDVVGGSECNGTVLLAVLSCHNDSDGDNSNDDHDRYNFSACWDNRLSWQLLWHAGNTKKMKW